MNSSRQIIATSGVRFFAALGLVCSVVSCTPGEIKEGLGPDEASAAAVEVTPERSSIAVGEAVLVRASARSSNGQPVPAEIEWSADGGTLLSLDDSTAQFSSASAGNYKIRGRGKKSPNPRDSTIIVVNPPPVSPIVSLDVSPNAASLASGGVQAFTVSATRQDGTTLTPGVTWSATGGSINTSGVYTAGGSAGTFRVIAVLQGGTLADTSAVTITVTPPVLQAVILAPSAASLATGATQQFSVSGQWSDGSTTAPAVTWTATGGTVTSNGLYTAGSTAGSFRVIARQSGGTLADTATVTLSTVPPVLQAVILTPSSVALNTGATQQFSVSGQWSDGSTTAPGVTWTATGGSVNGNGLYTAGNTAGTFRVIARQSGGTLADTSVVTLTAAPPVLQAVILTPSSVSLNTGATQQFSVSGQWSNGATTAPSVTYSATGGTITSGGLYTAGNTAGTLRVIATQQGGTLADTSVVTLTAAPPVLQAVILTPASVSLNTGATQQFSVSGQWSNGATTAPSVTYTATGGTVSSGGLYTAGGTAGTYRVIAVQQGGTLADTAVVTLSAVSGGGTTLLTEGFEDANISSRGWFDATSISTIADARPGSSGTKALQWHWTSGMTAPQGSSRIDFAASNSVYLSYWVKVSSNWIGSGVNYHPHMFHFLTTVDDRYIGPSITHLTLYDELLYDPARGGIVPILSMQDALMIDPTKLMVDLTNVTEQRAIGGYNGRPEPGLNWDAFDYGGGLYTNYKNFMPGTLVMTDATKNSWHHVESYWQLNTISGGKGQPNGVVQYWFDGALLIDRHDIYFRTAVNSSMQFRTFVMAPYIGDGSPRDQYMWIDDLVVRTARP